MKRHANGWWAALCLLCLLPLATRAQPADPSAWGVYAQLLGGQFSSEKSQGQSCAWAWAWDGATRRVVEDRCATGGTSQIASLGGGRLARLVNDKHTWTGLVQADGAVVWEPEGDFPTRVASDPYRVRLEGGVVVMEYVRVVDGRVADAWPMERLVSAVTSPAPATVPPAAAVVLAPLPAASEAEAVSAPRALSEADLARLRTSMARDKQQRADTLKRQQEEARQQAEAQRRAAEAQAQRLAQQQQEEDDDDDSDGFATALMSGLSVFQGEMSKYRAQQAQQQAFVANLQRQQAEARRQRELDQQRQAAAQAQAQAPRQQVGATSQQNQQLQQQQQQQELQRQQAVAREAAARAEADRQLRERAAAERLRQQQLREQQQAEARLASVAAGAAPSGGRASTNDDPSRCVSQPSQVPNPNCKDGSAFTMHNSCAQTVEMRLCIKTRQGSWDCGMSQGIPPGGSWGHPSCTGTSTTFLDVRSAGSGRRFADPPF